MTLKPEEPIDPQAEALTVLDILLLEYGSDESVANVSELDGLFAALGCAPETIMPSTWVPAIWDGVQPEWDCEAEADDFFACLFELYNSTMGALMSGDYEPLFYEHEAEGKTTISVDDWCYGFMRGLHLWGPLPAAESAIIDGYLEEVRLFGTTAGWERLDSMSSDAVEAAQRRIEPQVRALHAHFLARRSAGVVPVVRAQPNVGRNDPCPCGSGNKYKHCCLN